MVKNFDFGTTKLFTAKMFAKYMDAKRTDFLNSCKQENNRDYNTTEEIKMAGEYFPKKENLYKYGYYFYNYHTNCYRWYKKKPEF